MKRSSFVLVAILMAFCALSVFADVTGAWTGQFTTNNGEIKVSFTFRQDGAKLTGTVTGPEGEPIEISDGKVDGDKLSFTVMAHDMHIRHEGTIAGDQIKLTVKADNPDFPVNSLTLTRSK